MGILSLIRLIGLSLCDLNFGQSPLKRYGNRKYHVANTLIWTENGSGHMINFDLSTRNKWLDRSR